MNFRTFQERVAGWITTAFTREVVLDQNERNHRFLEEALELVQSLECTRSEAHMLVDYVFNQEVGQPEQEVGGVLVTLGALCNTAEIDMENCSADGLAYCWDNIQLIRAKQVRKPRSSSLPGQVLPSNGVPLNQQPATPPRVRDKRDVYESAGGTKKRK